MVQNRLVLIIHFNSRQRLGNVWRGWGGGLRLEADSDSRQLALTSQKYTLKSMILKDTPSGVSQFVVTLSRFLIKFAFCSSISILKIELN